jgi:FAD/FMN-containing dehydrogenase
MFNVTNKISGWGNYPVMRSSISYPSNRKEAVGEIIDSQVVTPRGNGRSYGDAALGSKLLASTGLDEIGEIDTVKGEVTCQSGVLLSDLLDYLIPQGYFLPVVPGTKYITIGGAVAADVHGKNHFMAGSISRHVTAFTLITDTGAEIKCTASENETTFYSTFGGMGLTGFIVNVTLSLIPIKGKNIIAQNRQAQNLSDLFRQFENDIKAEYKVAWYDCFTGKGIYTSAYHKTSGTGNSFSIQPSGPTINIPFTMPAWLLNRTAIKLMNKVRLARTVFDKETAVDYNQFFFPLDAIGEWNKLYGPNGFLQYQFAVPSKFALSATHEVVEEISKSSHYCMLAVIKQLGPGNDKCPLSFPMEGYTVALDFKNQPGIVDLLRLLDKIVVKYKGRIYLAKDACMDYETMKAGYPDLDTFKKTVQLTNSSHKYNSAQCQRIGYLK